MPAGCPGRAMPSRAVPSRALILTGDILGGCWRQLCPESQEPRQDEHAAGLGHGAGDGAAPAGLPGRPLSSFPGGAGGRQGSAFRVVPKGRAGPGSPFALAQPKYQVSAAAGCRPGRGSLEETGRPRRKLAWQERQPTAASRGPRVPHAGPRLAPAAEPDGARAARGPMWGSAAGGHGGRSRYRQRGAWQARVRQGHGVIRPCHCGHELERSPRLGPLMPRGRDEPAARMGAAAQLLPPLTRLLLQPLVLLQLSLLD